MNQLTVAQARDICNFAALLISFGYGRLVAQAAIFLLKQGEVV